MSEKLKKSFKRGDIVYWCHRSGHEFSVHWGMVDEQFSDAVIVDYLVPRERRLVNGIPIDKFESEYRYKKLPKGWTYKTRLFNITHEPLGEKESEFKLKIDNPQSIKEAYEMGYLVKDSTIFHGRIEEDITKEGFRIIKKYDYRDHHIDHVSIVSPELYFKYDEAKKVVDENILGGFLERENISLEEYLTNKKYVVIQDGDETCYWNAMKKTGLVNMDIIDYEYPKE